MTTQGTRVKLTGPQGSEPGRPDDRRGGSAAGESPALEGYLAEPRAAGRAGGVVVIQEWFGINDHMKWMVERIAEAGFVALAPDLFHGRVATSSEQASQMLAALDKKRALAEVGEAARYLSGHARCNGKVATVGFCMGGALALSAARYVEGLAASVAFYGIPEAPVEDLAKIAIPVQAHFGKKDGWAKASSAEPIQAAVRSRGGRMDLFVYDAGHAFMRASDPATHEPKSAALAWDRLMDFLKETIS